MFEKSTDDAAVLSRIEGFPDISKKCKDMRFLIPA